MSQESHRPEPVGGEPEPGFSVSDGYATELAFVLRAWEDGTLGDEQTETTLRELAASAPSDTATAAALHLGDLLARRGAIEEARSAYVQASGGDGEAAAAAVRALDGLRADGA